MPIWTPVLITRRQESWWRTKRKKETDHCLASSLYNYSRKYCLTVFANRDLSHWIKRADFPVSIHKPNQSSVLPRKTELTNKTHTVKAQTHIVCTIRSKTQAETALFHMPGEQIPKKRI